MRATAKSQKSINLLPKEFARLRALGYKAVPATLSQTMGPNWRHIFFVSSDGSNRNRQRVHYYEVDMSPEALHAIAKSEG